MGSLPADRVTKHFPFSVVGVDYAGPLIIKDKKGRGSKSSKCYVCVFICFSVKAVHIEVVSDLTTNSFLMALRRFAARRGKPAKIYSDNGSNFVGANNKLKDFLAFIKSNNADISNSCVDEGIEWHFIPPNSPHFGGLWEAGVKSVKSHLRRVAGNASLTFEELNTLLVQIEAVLNSRPLSPLSSNSQDLSALTPSHFLVGRPLTAIVEHDLTAVPSNRLQRFEHIQQILQHFWRRWQREYLSELQERKKWRSNIGDQPKVGQLVLIKEDGQPPLQWKLGRIVKLHSGRDEITRVVTLKTEHGEMQRSVAKLCPLPNQSPSAS
ncbi:hypothetical protein PPYR_09107 [Photinus pyralis]|uniref:Integrase catalytic domain-containing protein n=2 Tax=Photinus pyralis TaxID=7054 RepID=A0A5N4ALC6_PHOPY|nr:hypothetical protein PPYR_09107 [Photinus pyralis]